jgi:hypothetical protein
MPAHWARVVRVDRDMFGGVLRRGSDASGRASGRKKRRCHGFGGERVIIVKMRSPRTGRQKV